MTVITGSLGASSKVAAAPQQSAKFNEFQKQVVAGRGARGWQELRRVARELFGEKVFFSVPGQQWKRLVLSNAQLQKFAEDPAAVKAAIQKLQSEGTLPKDTAKWSAKDATQLFAKSARAAFPGKFGTGGGKNDGSFTIATVNDDFTDRKTNLRQVKADVVMVQEAKNTVARKVVGKNYGVHQNTRRDDQQGTALLWNKKEVKAGKRGYALGVTPHGRKMMTRWINWTDVTVEGKKVRMVSVHRPPKRFAALWPAFDAQLARFIKNTKLPIIVGMDSNTHDHAGFAKRTGLHWAAPKGSIDGFYVSPGIVVDKIWRMPKGTSDHNPVVAKLHFKK